MDAGGGVFTGDVTLSKDVDIIFEGATDDAYETKLTVVDPTADRTISLPDSTGTLLTTGDVGSVTSSMILDGTIEAVDIKNATITGAKLVNDTVTGTQIAASAIGSSELADNSVTTAKIVADAVTNAKIADNSIDSEHYVDGSIDNVHLADDAVDSDEIAAGAIDLAHMSVNSIDSDQYVDASIDSIHIANDQIDSQHYAAGSIDLEHMAANSVDSDQYVDGSIDLAHMSSNSVDSDQYVDGSIDGVHIANDAIDSQHYVDGSIDAQHLAGEAVGFAKLATADVYTSSETWSASNTKLATASAIDSRITTLVEEVGGFVAIDDETKFPDTNPDINDNAGTLVSVKALASNLTSNGSGVATIANGNVSNNATITINGLANSNTYLAGAGILVETTSTLHTYNFHRELPSAGAINTVNNNINNINIVAGDLVYKEDLGLVTESVTTETVGSDITTVATNINDINSFSDIYRVASSTPSSSIDAGDLWYDSTNNLLKYYNNSSWISIAPGIANLVEDTTPELGGHLDCNNKNLTEVATVSGDNLQIDFGTL